MDRQSGAGLLSARGPASDATLVTGGCGFIGSHLVERLLAEGREVYVVDDLSTGRLANLAAVRRHPKLHLVVDSIMNWPMMNEVIGNVGSVIHLAAVVGVRKVLDDPVGTITTNVRGSEIVLDCCARSGAKLFIASTSEIYGKAGENLHEDQDRIMGSMRDRRWAYACTKAMDEFLSLAYHEGQGLPVVIGRLFNVAGPRQTGEYGMVLPAFVASALRSEPIRVFGDGSQRRCFCHVADAVDAVGRLMASSDAVGGIFNIGGEREITILELAEMVKERSGSSSAVEFVPHGEARAHGFEDMERRQADLGRIAAAVGWGPTRALEAIVDETIEYFRAAPAGVA